MTQHNDIPSNTTPPPGVSVHYELPAKKPIITYTLLASTILIYCLQFLSKQFFQIDVLAIYGMKINELINEGQVWRLITSMFLHADIVHIGFNMYALYAFGRRLERFYGHGRFLILYFISGLAGSIVSYYFTNNPSLGASTAIFGLVAAEGVFIYTNKKFFPNANKALRQLIMIIIINFILGLSPQIDNWGHLGGFIGGLAFAWFAGPLLDAKITETGIKLFDKHIGKLSTITIIIEFLILAMLTAIRVVIN
ncbi:MAG: rhomboid family intramembrane serine protease [Anaerolineaceae bacterium]|nr:rhomboid family intramembrane serine protease [Anaerolineaceae bacterium]